VLGGSVWLVGSSHCIWMNCRSLRMIGHEVFFPGLRGALKEHLTAGIGEGPLHDRAHTAATSDLLMPAYQLSERCGSGIDPLSWRSHMVVDVGGGTAEVTAFCFRRHPHQQVVAHIAGDEMTLALHQYLLQTHQLLVGELTAEDLKFHLRQTSQPSGSGVV